MTYERKEEREEKTNEQKYKQTNTEKDFLWEFTRNRNEKERRKEEPK